MASDAPPVDLSRLSAGEARARIGELVELCLRRSGACVIVRRRTGELTIVDPKVLDSVPEEDIASYLLTSWSEDEVLEFLHNRAKSSEG